MQKRPPGETSLTVDSRQATFGRRAVALPVFAMKVATKRRMGLVELGSDEGAQQRAAGEVSTLHSMEEASWTCANAGMGVGAPASAHACTEGLASSSMHPLWAVAAVPIVAREEAIPEALVSGRPHFGELEPGAAVTASLDVGALGYTQMERRKQLAIQWYCVSCKETYMSRTLMSCRQCGVTMVCSAPAQIHDTGDTEALRLEPRMKCQKRRVSNRVGSAAAGPIERAAGMFSAEEMSAAVHADSEVEVVEVDANEAEGEAGAPSSGRLSRSGGRSSRKARKYVDAGSSAGEMDSEEEEAKTLPRSRPARSAIGYSTHDCVCIVLQGTLSLARVRLSL